MTGVWLALVVALAGGVGAACRMVLDGAMKRAVRVAYPLGTTVINVSGSLVLGFVTALGAGLGPWAVVLGTGLIGGYTTFSTASYETVRLAQEGRWRAAVGNAFGMLVVALGAAALGLWLGWLVAGSGVGF
ncbi:CrcB family protein [Microbacterium protaetiae]|uniref:Fluoride-specific ion channel FluC n=1 Tax=Microbacterium protaetiae TaxID=2509458 RepID=A0A4P6ENL3_9MICO|nr:CrcB family protein [Microbacterium protaetiae]QAY59478.1 CrcB family protein [Microbacterium protaetiae]